MTIEADKTDLTTGLQTDPATDLTRDSNSTTRDVGYRRLFRLPGFPKLAAATVLARTGGQLWQIALVLFVLQRFHSPALAGFATFVAIVPGLVVSPLAGALLDRYGCLRLIRVDLSVAALALVLLAALSLANALTPATLLVIVALSSLTSPLTISGTRTLFPRACRASFGTARTGWIVAAWRWPWSSVRRWPAFSSRGSAARARSC